MWITNGSMADVAVVWARTDPDGPDGGAVRGFVVPTDTPGFSAPEIHRKVSLRASVTSELVLDGVRLPAERCSRGSGHARSAVLPQRGTLRDRVRRLRCGEGLLRVGAGLSPERRQFDRPIAWFQLTQRKLVEMMVEVQRGTLVALHLGRLKDAGTLATPQIRFAKMDNVRMALEVAREARSVLGANGITTEYPVIRHMNNLESVYTYEGTNEVHTLILGQAITGIPAFE